MYTFRALLLKPQNHLHHSNRTPSSLPSIVHRALSSSSQNPKTNAETETRSNELSGSREGDTKNGKEQTVFVKNWNSEKPKSMYALFSGRNGEMMGEEKEEKQPKVFKELSPDMRSLVLRLYSDGYFNEASFLKGRRLDFCCFDDSYGRGFIKSAAEKFGQDHQDIAKWLSGKDLKNLALFGCPTLMRKNVFSAKRLRKYFRIEESTVCSKCILKHSCNFANQNIWRSDAKTLSLAVVMRVITQYAMEEVQPELTVPDGIKATVSRLLEQVLRLSRTVS